MSAKTAMSAEAAMRAGDRRASMGSPTAPLAFITGASSGIGQALALAYLQRGWRVALLARRADRIEQWLDAERVDRSRVLVLPADVTDADAVIEAAQQCLARFGLPNVVVANAGVSVGMDSTQREDLDVMARLLATNVSGLVASFHPFVGAMRARGSGTLVGVASVAGMRGLPGHGAYCASKAAAITYCESLRVELRGSGVRVVTLAPGYVDTPLTRKNRHPMPFLLPADRFARLALQAIDAGARLRVIPWQMAWVARLLRVLPAAWVDAAVARAPRKHRDRDALQPPPGPR